MADYQPVSRQLSRVRRAWKRAAGLSGVAVVLVEAIGMFTLVLLIDVLYRPGLGGRIVLLVLSASGVAYLAFAHVLKPLVRHIPDEQIALYVEERNPNFEGALMSAAEFGRKQPPMDADARRYGKTLLGRAVIGVHGSESAVDAVMRDAIIDAAVARAKRFDLRSAVDLSRLRKYGVAAGAACMLYLGMGLLAPKTMARHARRCLTPWRAPSEDEAAAMLERGRQYYEELGPVTFVLSSYDTRLLRGSPFDLEAGLSRASPDPVLFHFRPLAEMSEEEAGTKHREKPPRRPGAPLRKVPWDVEPAVPVIGEDVKGESEWRTLAMHEIEKLHGYRIALPDVNEDIAFFVSTGDFLTDCYRIEVYDPLRLRGFEIGVRFPEYLKMLPRLEEQPTGDVSVPEGSSVTVRIVTNGRLEGGELLWADGETQELVVSDGRITSAAASFRALKDRSYNFSVRDINGQVLSSYAPALVHAIKDSPPSLQVIAPKIDIGAHPLAEVAFRVEAKDDWGVESVELVYRLGIEEDAAPVRIPLELEPRGPAGQRAMTTANASYDMLFEDHQPPLGPGDLMTYHFETRDRKGHAVISDVFFITVMPFEVWGTWLPLPAEEGGGGYVPAAVERYVAAAWHLKTQKDSLSREEYERACEKLAEEFVSEGVTLWDYVREPW